MITDKDIEILENEESTHLRLNSKFMESIGIETVDCWTHNFIVYVPIDIIKIPFLIKGSFTENGDLEERYTLMSYDDFVKVNGRSSILGKVAWCDVNGYRIIGILNHRSLWKERYSIIVERVDKLTKC